MIRYGVQIITNKTNIRWISIGTGTSEDIQQAHLYTSEDLANAKIKTEIKAHKAWIEHTGNSLEYKIIKFNVQVATEE